VIVVLTASLVPAVAAYFSKGTPSVLQPDMKLLQAAVTGFAADVRHYPGDLQQLVTPIVATSGDGDTLDFDGSATPVQFTSVEASRWRGPYTSAPISTGRTGGGQFTSTGLLVTIGRRITPSGGWLAVPILSPTTCAAILALDRSIDDAPLGGNTEGTDGAVVWSGTCSRSSTSGSVTNPTLRVARAN
jgi:hypothetical protein